MRGFSGDSAVSAKLGVALLLTGRCNAEVGSAPATSLLVITSAAMADKMCSNLSQLRRGQNASKPSDIFYSW